MEHHLQPGLSLRRGPHTMAANTGSGVEPGVDIVRAPQAVDRITVALIPQAGTGLQGLQDRTGLSKTDIANRAITLYEFIDAQMRAGRDVLIRDNTTEAIEIVRLL